MSTTAGPPIDATMGVMLLGTIVSAILLGVSYIQTFYYFLDYPHDGWLLKSLVVSTVVLDTAHMSLLSHSMYFYLIKNFYNPLGLNTLVWSAVVEALCTTLTAFLVQCFYLVRVYRLSKSLLLTATILLFILGHAGCGLAWVVLSMELGTFTKLLGISRVTNLINATSMIADVLIAGSLVIMLRKARTGFRRSDSMINKLILFVVNTGVLTSCCAIASFISLLVSPNTLIYAAFYFCIGRLYTNSFLAALNARRIIHGNDDASHMMVSTPPSLRLPTSASQKKVQNISIQIETTQERFTKCDNSSSLGPEKSEDDLASQRTL